MYGTEAHEAWLIELERTDVADERPDQPWTPCGCTARAYGGDCAHTVDEEFECGGPEETDEKQITCAECGAEDIEYLPHNPGCPDRYHDGAVLTGGTVPAHVPGAYPNLSCCGGPVVLVPAR